MRIRVTTGRTRSFGEECRSRVGFLGATVSVCTYEGRRSCC